MELVKDREKWRGIFRQAKVHSGLERQRNKTMVAHEKLGQLPLLTVYVVPV
jgi:hypothetical protein